MTTNDDRIWTTPVGSLPRLPELLDLFTRRRDVADRLERVADGTPLVAAPDCGFGTQAGIGMVDPEIAWAKPAALDEGAAIATDRIYG